MDNEERPVEKDDEYKEMASGKGCILATHFAIAMRELIGSPLVAQTQQEAWVSLQQGTTGERCFRRRRELEMASITAAKLLIPPVTVANR